MYRKHHVNKLKEHTNFSFVK